MTKILSLVLGMLTFIFPMKAEILDKIPHFYVVGLELNKVK
ncbi:hypothetical protein [uncultured Bacteroides sp.]|nr:hypothetical protein [uncultured Bacteroides sp.]